MIPRYLVLDSAGNAQLVDMVTWAQWIGRGGATLARDTHGPALVRTSFVGADGRLTLMFETVVFGGALHATRDTYSSRAAALAGHARMLKRVRANLH